MVTNVLGLVTERGGLRFPGAAVTKYHNLGGGKPQNFILSQFWSLEAQNPGVGRATLPLKPLGEDSSLPLLASGIPGHSLTCGNITPISIFSLLTRTPVMLG